MAKVFSHPTISADGFIAGPNQTREDPLGQGGENLHDWMFTDSENNVEERDAITEHGAFIMGRNMFGPIRGDWTEEDWRGWWGDNPPYHAPVFVLTHFPHDPIEMEGGTTFHFVTTGPEDALRLAREAAGDRSISVAGGGETIKQFLRLGAIDELRLAVSSALLGEGVRLLEGIPNVELEPVSARHSKYATFITYRPKLKS